MGAEQILSIFPGSSDRQDIKHSLESTEGYPNYGVAQLQFQLPTYPSIAKDRFAGIPLIEVKLFDGRVAEYDVEYAGRHSRPAGPFWPNVDDFIEKLSEAFALPTARDWLPHGASKTLKCNGWEIEANANFGGEGSFWCAAPPI